MEKSRKNKNYKALRSHSTGKKAPGIQWPGSSQALPAIICVIWSKSLQILSLGALISENQGLA